MDSRPAGLNSNRTQSKQYKKDENLALSASTVHFPNDWTELILFSIHYAWAFMFISLRFSWWNWETKSQTLLRIIKLFHVHVDATSLIDFLLKSDCWLLKPFRGIAKSLSWHQRADSNSILQSPNLDGRTSHLLIFDEWIKHTLFAGVSFTTFCRSIFPRKACLPT